MEEKLVEIADAVGVEVSELWAWLKNGGIQAYQAAKVAELGTLVGICLFAIVAMVCLYIRTLLVERELDGKEAESCTYYYNADDVRERLLWERVVYSLLFGAATTMLIMSMPRLMGWMVSPEGMVLSIIANG